MRGKLKKYIIPIIVLIISLMLSIFLWYYNKMDFLKATIMQVLPFLFAVSFPFYYKLLVDEEKVKKEFFVKRLYDFRKELKNNSIVISTDIQRALIEQTRIANEIEYYVQHIKIKCVEKDLQKLKSEIISLKELYGNYVHNKEQLEERRVDFERMIGVICDKTLKVEIKLFF